MSKGCILAPYEGGVNHQISGLAGTLGFLLAVQVSSNFAKTSVLTPTAWAAPAAAK